MFINSASARPAREWISGTRRLLLVPALRLFASSARWSLVATIVLINADVATAAAPGVPGELAAVVTGNSVTITWQPPAGGAAPLGYLVEAALSPGGPVVAAFLVIQPSIVLNAVPNGVYYVRVRAGNAEGIGASSSEAIVSVPGGGGPCTTPPGAPGNLNASVSNSTVTLTWQPASAGCAATAYVVQAGSAPGLSDLAIFNVGNTTRLSVTAPVGTYFVRVVGVNAFGGSVPSNELTVTVGPIDVDLTGVWFGTSDYINAPFTMTLTDRGTGFGGTYRDQKDFGGVAGSVTGNQVVIDVNFGDGGFRMFGTIESTNRIRGTFVVGLLGGRRFTFEMTR
jgi:hypothetical protein